MDATTCQDNRYETNEYLAPDLAHLTIRVQALECAEGTRGVPCRQPLPAEQNDSYDLFGFDLLGYEPARCSRG